MTDPLSPRTLLAQGYHQGDAATGAINPAISPSSTYVRDDRYQLPGSGYSYGRDDNAGFEAAEVMLAGIEGGAGAMLFSSGMAAASAVMQSLSPGEHVVAPRVMYWGLRNWLSEFCDNWGVGLSLFDPADPDALERAIRPRQTRLVWIETPCNPTWSVIDIAAAAEAAHRGGARLVVDSTAATPVLTRPIELGADLVMHSATKYLNGHSDIIAGALVTAERDEWWERLRGIRIHAGAIPGSFEAWLLQRGMRTLFLRVDAASRSAQTIAEHFLGHSGVDSVLYPGLPSHPGHDIARRQMSGGFGGMLSLRVRGGAKAALSVACRCRVFARATSLGGVESLIEHRHTIEGESSPVPPDLLRLSVGIEQVDDLVADLEQALAPT